jgi:MFS family permease
MLRPLSYVYGEYYVDPTSAYGITTYIPAAWLGLWNGLGAIGNMCGALFAGWMQDRFGRRISLGCGAIIAALGIGIIYASNFASIIDGKRGIFLVGKVIEGFAIGQVAASTQTYLSEITPPSLRGPVFAFFPAIILCGQLIGAGILFKEIYIVAPLGYETCMLSMFAFSGAVLIVAFIIPESPTWLTRLGRLDAARKSQRRLERADADSGHLIDGLVMVIEQEKHESHADDKVSLVQCFKGVDGRRTWIVILCNTMTNMFGISFLATSTYFYELLGVEAGLAIKLLEVGIGIGIAANFISIWTTTKFSRRSLLIGTFIIITLLWLAVGISGCFAINHTIS